MDPSAHRGSPSRPLQSRHRDNKNDEENQQRSRFSRTETLAGFRIYQPSRRRDRSPAAASSAALPSVYWDNKKNKEIDGESDANLAGYTFYREPTPTPPEFEDSEKRVGHGGPRLAAFTDSSTAGGGTIRSDGDHSQRPLNLGGAAGWNGGADNNSIAISPRTKKKALWGIFAIGALVLIGVAVGVGVGLGIGLKAKGETVKPTDIPSRFVYPGVCRLADSALSDGALVQYPSWDQIQALSQQILLPRVLGVPVARQPPQQGRRRLLGRPTIRTAQR